MTPGTLHQLIRAPRKFLESLFEHAVGAVAPENSIVDFLPLKPRGKTVAVAVGKAAVPMAAAFEKLWPHGCEGFALTRYGHAAGHSLSSIKIFEAAHPVPDQAGLQATQEIIQALSGLTADDLVVALISGGGSSLLVAPPAGVSLEDEQQMHKLLLASGLGIQDMNLIRKHVSRVKGGGLARLASPAQMVSFVLSDIPGDDIRLVASGPTLPDPRGRDEALAVIARAGLKFPDSITKHLESSLADAPNPEDPVFENHQSFLVGSAQMAMDAALDFGRDKNLSVQILSDQIEDECRQAARWHSQQIRRWISNPETKYPMLFLSGGETRVELRGQGRGGRNSEFLLALALEVEDLQMDFRIHGLACDTDGIDGSENNAGAVFDPETLQRLRAAGCDPTQYLMNNDAYTAFEKAGGLVVTGPTGTNVNDFRAILIERL